MYSRLDSDTHSNCKTAIKLLIMSAILCSSVTFAQEQTKDTEKPGFITTATNWFDTVKLPDYLQIHGFASQAFISTSDNDVFGDTDDDGSFGFTEAGLNALLRPLPRLQLSAQVLSRRAGEGNSGTPRLDFGFADYRLYSHETNQFGIRVGRLKNPFGFYNETRDVAFTRPSILLPQSIYFDRTRNLGLSSDAIHLYADSSQSNLGSFSVIFGIGNPIVDDRDTEAAIVGLGRTGNLTSNVSYIGRGIYETNDGRIRLAVSGSSTKVDYKPGGINDLLGSGSVRFSPILFSAQYNTERWSLTSEYALRFFTIKDFNPTQFSNRDFVGESFYFQGEYRFNQKWEALLRYDVLFADRSDRKGKRFARSTGRPAHTQFAKDLTVGLRWNVTPKIMIRAEYHRINGTGWLSILDNPDVLDTSKNWNLFAAQLSYRF